MNGDEVRRLILPTAMRGYDSAAVEELLDRVAAELDAGRPVTPLIETATFPWQTMTSWRDFKRELTTSLWYPPFLTGCPYECADVDGVLSQLRRQDDPAARADPWRDLPVWCYGMASRDAGGGSLAARAARKGAVQDYARACAEAWRDFGLQPGIQLCWVKTGARAGELRAGGQSALVPALTRHGRSFSVAGRTYRLSRVTAAQWPAIAAEISARIAELRKADTAVADLAARKPWGLNSLTDQAGQPVLYTAVHSFWSGYGELHRDRDAWGFVQFPGQRWLRFPVRGTDRPNAIMTAVDQTGRKVARYRIASRNPVKNSRRAFKKWREIEITVHPDQQLTDELILTLAVTAPWISDFFDSSNTTGSG